jgi:hypothetical protein
MRGYLFSALTALLFLSAFMFSIYFLAYSRAAYMTDIRWQKTACLFDDVAGDIQALTMLSGRVDNGGQTVVYFYDSLGHDYDIPSAVRNYSIFLSGNYSGFANLRLNVDFAALSSSTRDVDCVISPAGFSYGYSNLSKKKVFFRNISAENPPKAVNMSFGFLDDIIEDIVWVEAQDMDSLNAVVADDEDASAGAYVRDFSRLNTTEYFGLRRNYTLWVRAFSDDTDKNFTVEVAGENSSRFDIRDEGGTGGFMWFNDTLKAFNLSEGYHSIRVHPGSGTASVDVILLSTKHVTPDNSPPIERPLDGISVFERPGEDLDYTLNVFFDNGNYSIIRRLDRAEVSQWNLTFEDGDILKLRVGGLSSLTPGESVFEVVFDNHENSSSGSFNSTALFDSTGERAYVGCGIELTSHGDFYRSDEIWLAKG